MPHYLVFISSYFPSNTALLKWSLCKVVITKLMMPMKSEYFSEKQQVRTTIMNKLLILASYKNSEHNMKCKYLPVIRKCLIFIWQQGYILRIDRKPVCYLNTISSFSVFNLQIKLIYVERCEGLLLFNNNFTRNQARPRKAPTGIFSSRQLDSHWHSSLQRVKKS